MTDSPHILVVDDHQEIRDLLARHLKKEGFRVAFAADGKAMWRLLADARIDLIVLDIMMPGDDGLTLCRKLRAEKTTASVPIVMLTAKGEEFDRVLGLEMGADDYLAKPFSARELVARIRAVLRRVGTGQAVEPVDPGQVVRFADWAFDMDARHLEAADGTIVSLSTGEYDLLAVFVQRPGRVLNRDQLLDLTRGGGGGPPSTAVSIPRSAACARRSSPTPVTRS
jgi:two-component system OmpR family response regulator